MVLEVQNEKTIPPTKIFRSKDMRRERKEGRKRTTNSMDHHEGLQEPCVSLYDIWQTRGYIANYGFGEQNQVENREGWDYLNCHFHVARLIKIIWNRWNFIYSKTWRQISNNHPWLLCCHWNQFVTDCAAFWWNGALFRYSAVKTWRSEMTGITTGNCDL